MGIFNRGLLFIYTLLVGAFCAGMVTLCLHVVPDRVLLNEYEYFVNQWQTAAAAGVGILLSLHLLLCSFDRSNKQVNAKDLLLINGGTGQISVSLAAIRNMAESMAMKIRGVQQAKVKSRVEHRKEQGDFLKLELSLEVSQERNIPELSDELRQQLAKYLVEVAGIDDVDIKISVQSIASGVTVKKRRIK